MAARPAPGHSLVLAASIPLCCFAPYSAYQCHSGHSCDLYRSSFFPPEPLQPPQPDRGPGTRRVAHVAQKGLFSSRVARTVEPS